MLLIQLGEVAHQNKSASGNLFMGLKQMMNGVQQVQSALKPKFPNMKGKRAMIFHDEICNFKVGQNTVMQFPDTFHLVLVLVQRFLMCLLVLFTLDTFLLQSLVDSQWKNYKILDKFLLSDSLSVFYYSFQSSNDFLVHFQEVL